MIVHETYQFICKACDNPYRGLVKKCPHCGAEIRSFKKWTDSAETKKDVAYTCSPSPEDLLVEEVWYHNELRLAQEYFNSVLYQGSTYEPDYDADGNVIGYSIVPKKR